MNAVMPTQIEALKEVGVTEVVLAINYQPEVTLQAPSLSVCLHQQASKKQAHVNLCRALRSI
jgi:hypothetical protein